jgi:hypothetical protein
MNDTPLEDIFSEAIEKFPFPDLSSTSCTQGDWEQNDLGDVEYSEEFTFHAGTICDMYIEGGGWIDCRKEYGEILITGIFGLARDGDWRNGSILPEGHTLQGWYNLEKKTWSFMFDVL